jgi:hypothetical protein
MRTIKPLIVNMILVVTYFLLFFTVFSKSSGGDIAILMATLIVGIIHFIILIINLIIKGRTKLYGIVGFLCGLAICYLIFIVVDNIKTNKPTKIEIQKKYY